MMLSALLLCSLSTGVVLASPAPGQYRRDVANFTNPIVYEDLADLDVIRVGSTFYYTASSMHYSPGAPILRSYDLVNWEFIGHAVPELDWGDKYYLNDTSLRGYNAGIWASTMQYRASTDTFHWMGCIDFISTRVLTSAGGSGNPAASSWVEHPAISTCYYDCGLLIDDNDDMYVAYGSTNINVAKLSADGLSEESTQVVYSSSEYIEGSRFYQRNGTYYILVTRPTDTELVLKSDSVWGPYEEATLVEAITPPLDDASSIDSPDGVGLSGDPHQGGLVSTESGDWYYAAFVDAYPGGRIPVLAPVTWDADGWPVLVTDENGGWGQEYPIPVETDQTVASLAYLDTFEGDSLSAHWEWNHNPNNTRWSLTDDGLVLQTATITTDFYSARNTLSQRTLGPFSSGVFHLDVSSMVDGDRAGAALLRDHSGYVGVWKDAGVVTITMVDGLQLTATDTTWETTSNGTVEVTGPVLTSNEVWFRIAVDIRPVEPLGTYTRNATFAYSLDGTTFTKIGPTFLMQSNWEFFMGPRFSVFNYATEQLGGELLVKEFTLTQEDYLLDE